MTQGVHQGTVESKEKIQDSKTGYTRRVIRVQIPQIGTLELPRTIGKGVPLSVGDTVDLKMKKTSKNKWTVEGIVNVNGAPPTAQTTSSGKPDKTSKQSKLSSLANAIQNRYRGRQGFIRRLYLAAMGGASTDYAALESRAQSLEPFIEYIKHSKQTYKLLQQKAKFRWTPVEDEKYITITKQHGTKIRVESQVLPYRLKKGPAEAIIQGGKLLHPDGDDAEILVVKTNSLGTEFLTNKDLNSKTGWMIWGGIHSMTQIEWEPNQNAKPIETVSADAQAVRVLNQTKKGEWIELVLDVTSQQLVGKNLEFDNSEMNWQFMAQPDVHGPLYDQLQGGRQITGQIRMNAAEAVRFLPAGDVLHDADGVRYSFKKSIKSGDSTKIRIHLDERIEKNLDDERETNPMDLLFSPDSEYNELVVNFNPKKPMKEQKTVRVFSKDANNKTITIAKPRFKLQKNDVLSLQPNLFYVQRQLEMFETLRDYPLPHHNSLLKLTEKGTTDARDGLWPTFDSSITLDWNVLTRDTNGTKRQQEFVQKAVSTPDFAILQGPPGSGKTTAIIELIAQFTQQNKKVLLCGSTQASIDNVLLRIKENKRLSEYISPLRIGRKEGIYDSGVHGYVLSEQIDRLTENGLEKDVAQDLCLRQANLTCGTMQGIISHPWIKGSTHNQGKKLKAPQAHFDVLIVDEASKTTFQQFILPAAYCRRWVLVGDVQQLPPFLEASEMMTNLEMMTDDKGKKFTTASQRACLLLRNITRYQSPKSGHPIVMVEGDKVPQAFIKEVNARKNKMFDEANICVIGSKRCESKHAGVRFFTPNDIQTSDLANMVLQGSSIVIIGANCYSSLADYLPIHSIIRNGTIAIQEVTENRKRLHEERNSEEFFHSYHPMHQDNLLTEWTYQLSWRMNRAYELKVSKNTQQKNKLEQEIDQYLPQSQNVRRRLEEIRSIALPSVLECLQYGFATGEAQRLLPETTLTQGFPTEALKSRFSVIAHQHRMHPDISHFSHTEFYGGKALIDADTLDVRNKHHPFEYRQNLPRNTWIDVPAGKGGFSVNKGEVMAIKAELKAFIDYARDHPPSSKLRDNPEQWEIAVLSPYQKQRKALVSMVQDLTGLDQFMRFNLDEMKKPSPVSIVVSTTDRFQGQEADVVFISLRNADRVGFLDSPNRMNVALTRAREWRVIVGHHHYFGRDKRMRDPMLRKLAKTQVKVERKKWRN